eukprot:TRINITY_DN226_c1_g1_i1.p1 TRINITY_DN226_c1_g1~~TRINITY_DN226_c1_g1_i1.p1  ORF type:complete len:1406 (+),score=489.37 TRINITY_DN226_c1_g1_i1:84-4301(+)
MDRLHGVPSAWGAASSFGNVEVAVRVRPLLEKEVARGETPCAAVDAAAGTVTVVKPALSVNGAQIPGTGAGQSWEFDHVFGEDTTQTEIFEALGRPIVDHAFDGYNASVFAYGQTGSGKTYTIEGPHTEAHGGGYPDSPVPRGGGYPPEGLAVPNGQQGFIELVASALFEASHDKKAAAPGVWDFQAEISHVEVYNEKVRCLLQPRSCEPRIREHPITGPYVDGATKCIVNTPAEIRRLLKRASKTRTVGTTQANERSSRSHAIFMLTFTQIERFAGTTLEKESKLTLVDLAGSERLCAAAGETTTKEGTNINKSLTTLGNVINMLAERSEAPSSPRSPSRVRYIPYRDSSLTWLLRESLGGNSKTRLICTLPPTASTYELSLSTLRFADRAKSVVTRPVVNEDPSQRKIRLLRMEVDTLKQQLNEAGSPRSAAAAPTTDMATGIGMSFTDDETASPVALPASYDTLPAQHRLRETESVLEKLKEEWHARVEHFEEVQQSNVEKLSRSVAHQHDLGNKLQDLVGSLQSIHGSSQAEEANRAKEQSMELHRIREALNEVKSLVLMSKSPSPARERQARDMHPPPREDGRDTEDEEDEYEDMDDPTIEDPPAPAPKFSSSSRAVPAANDASFSFDDEDAADDGDDVAQSSITLEGGPAEGAAPRAPDAFTQSATPAPQPPQRAPATATGGWNVVSDALGNTYPTLDAAFASMKDSETGCLDKAKFHEFLQSVGLAHLASPFFAAVNTDDVTKTDLERVLQVPTAATALRSASGRSASAGGSSAAQVVPANPSSAASHATNVAPVAAPIPAAEGVVYNINTQTAHIMDGPHHEEVDALRRDNEQLRESVVAQEAATRRLQDDLEDLHMELSRARESSQQPHPPSSLTPLPPTYAASTVDPVDAASLSAAAAPGYPNPAPSVASMPPHLSHFSPAPARRLTSPPAPWGPPAAGATPEPVPFEPPAVADLRKQVDELKGEVEALKTAAEEAAAKAEEATAEAEEEAAERAAATEQVQDLEAQRDALAEELETLKEAAAGLEAEKVELAQEASDRKEEAQTLRDEAVGLRAVLQEKTKEMQERVRETEEAREAVATAAADRDTKQRKLEKELEDAGEGLALATGEAKELRLQLFRRTQQRDLLQKEQQRWEGDIAAARREIMRYQREKALYDEQQRITEELQSEILSLKELNMKLQAEIKTQGRLIRHREAKQEREQRAEQERSELVKKNIVDAATAEVEHVRVQMADLTKVCESQKVIIEGLEGDLGESRQKVKAVKQVGDEAIASLSDTLKGTLERLHQFESAEPEIEALREHHRETTASNAELQEMVQTLKRVLKQQTDALAEKELQLMRSGGRAQTPRTPRSGARAASPHSGMPASPPSSWRAGLLDADFRSPTRQSPTRMLHPHSF